MEFILILSAPLWPILLLAAARLFDRRSRGGAVLAFWRREPTPLAGYSLEEQPEITELAYEAADRARRARARDIRRRHYPVRN